MIEQVIKYVSKSFQLFSCSPYIWYFHNHLNSVAFNLPEEKLTLYISSSRKSVNLLPNIHGMQFWLPLISHPYNFIKLCVFIKFIYLVINHITSEDIKPDNVCCVLRTSRWFPIADNLVCALLELCSSFVWIWLSLFIISIILPFITQLMAGC